MKGLTLCHKGLEKKRRRGSLAVKCSDECLSNNIFIPVPFILTRRRLKTAAVRASHSTLMCQTHCMNRTGSCATCSDRNEKKKNKGHSCMINSNSIISSTVVTTKAAAKMSQPMKGGLVHCLRFGSMTRSPHAHYVSLPANVISCTTLSLPSFLRFE